MKAAKDNRIGPYYKHEFENWKRDSYIGIDYEEAKYTKTNAQNFIEYAVSVAKKSTMVQKHGCVIVLKNKIISVGFNYSIIPCKFSIHAEQDAINKAKKKISPTELKKCKLYVVRIGQDSMENPLKYSKPCPNCSLSIHNVGIKSVFYSTNFEIDTCVHNIVCNVC